MLLLGNSNDSGGWIDGGRQRHEIVRDRLAELYGEPVEVIPKNIWPNDSMPRVVDGWIEKNEPDVIYMTMAAYWFCYQSVPLRVRRLLKRLGPKVSDAGFRAAESPRWAFNPVFRGARGAMQRTLGGDTHFTTSEVIERVTATIQAVLRHEGVVLAIQGADGRTDYGFTRRSRARNERRRQEVHRALKEFCAEHHVTYENTETARWTTDKVLSKNRVGDGLHANARWHEHSAELIVGTISRGLAEAGQPAGAQDLSSSSVP